MPSALFDHVSEPVNLAANEDSPYEPPRRISTDKSNRPIHSAKAYIMNGKANDGVSSGKTIEGVILAETNGIADEGLETANARSGDGIERRAKSHSRSGSKSSPRSNIGINGTNATSPAEAAQGPAKTYRKERISSLQNLSSHLDTQLAGQDPALHKRLHTKGHARAHSSSTPPTPTLHNLTTSHAEGSSLNPHSHNFPNNNVLSPKSIHPTAPRLVSRHTLEVPRVSTSRSSRDFSIPYAVSDTGSESGRLSPTPRTPRLSHTLGRAATRSVHSDMYLDEVPHSEDMARWTENVRQKRASRKRRKEEEEDDRVLVGTKVDMNHVNWVTAYNMLTGIRFTVSRTNAKIDRELTDADFDAKHKFSFDITGNELTPSAKYDFKFKDYAPWVFRHLRAKFGRDPADYLVSLTSKYILSELGSPGKSGSFFYFSRDYKYIIKTIHHAEHKLLRKILREYYSHVEKYPNTLISQFYGLHRVKIPYGRKIHFVVMNNLFPPHRDIHQTFDLKGSTIGRDFKEDDLEKNPRATLKDLNWLRRNYHFEFGPAKKALFVEQMKHDVELLQRLKIMDYSMLVGIHDVNKGNEENLRDKTLQVFQPGGDGAKDSQVSMLTRTPSKLENARQARQLREIIKKEKPVPIDKSTSKMPDEILEERKNFVFYSDDGGFRATHEDGQPGEEIYYLGIIDCLTHYGIVKKAEHIWKGLSNNKSQISPIPPEAYGSRFVKFIGGLTMTREEAEREAEVSSAQKAVSLSQPNKTSSDFPAYMPNETSNASSRRNSSNTRRSTEKVLEKANHVAEMSERDGAAEDPRRDRTITAMRSPSAERSGGALGTTLPVVEEAGEAGSSSREESVMDEKAAAAAAASGSSGPSPSSTSAPPDSVVTLKGRKEVVEGNTGSKHFLDGTIEEDTNQALNGEVSSPNELPTIPTFQRLSMGLGMGSASPTKPSS